MSELDSLSRLLIAGGLLLLGVGLYIFFAGKTGWPGRLPGDIVIRKENFTFYFPSRIDALFLFGLFLHFALISFLHRELFFFYSCVFSFSVLRHRPCLCYLPACVILCSFSVCLTELCCSLVS